MELWQLAIGATALVVIVMWVFLPMIVTSKLTELNKTVDAIRKAVEKQK